MDESERHQLRVVFNTFDTNKDGVLDVSEINNALLAVATPQVSRATLRALPRTVTFEQFEQVYLEKRRKLRETFDAFDSE